MQARAPRMSTSYRVPFRAQTRPQHAPLLPQEQSESYGPGGSVPSHGGGPDPVPQQEQLQLTSNLTRYNGMFTLLGGALKVAGAVLGPTLLGGALQIAGAVLGPMLQDDRSSTTGN
jgi:hypothetical protein